MMARKDVVMSVEKKESGQREKLDEALREMSEAIKPEAIEIDKGIMLEAYFKCGYCDIPDRYDSREFVEQHHKVCIQNKENKSCATCKHFEAIKQAPYPRLAKNYNDIQLKVWLGSYITGFCGKKKRELYEKDYFKKYKCYEELDNNKDIVEHYTKEYKAFLDLMEKGAKGQDDKIEAMTD